MKNFFGNLIILPQPNKRFTLKQVMRNVLVQWIFVVILISIFFAYYWKVIFFLKPYWVSGLVFLTLGLGSFIGLLFFNLLGMVMHNAQLKS